MLAKHILFQKFAFEKKILESCNHPKHALNFRRCFDLQFMNWYFDFGKFLVVFYFVIFYDKELSLWHTFILHKIWLVFPDALQVGHSFFISSCFLVNPWSHEDNNRLKLALLFLFPQFGLSGNNPQRSHASQMLNDQSMNFVPQCLFFCRTQCLKSYFIIS